MKSRPTLHVLLAILLTTGCLHAAPYFGEETFTYRQPDGEALQIRLYGDEFFAYQETVDGYLVIRDPNNGLFCYAKVTPDGTDIISTGVRVGQAKPAGLNPKQRLAEGMAMVKSLGNRNLLGADQKGRRNHGKKLIQGKGGEILNVAIDETAPQSAPGDGSTTEPPPVVLPGPPSGPTLNQRVGLVLLASFPDLPGDVTKTVADIDNYCNAETYTDGGNATSIYGYFKIQSNGKLSYKNNVTAWFTAANPRAYYTDEAIPHGTRARELMQEGLTILKAKGFDFTQCDANNDGRLDGINIFHAGSRINAWAKGLWPHQSSSSWSGFSGTGLTSNSFEYQMTDMPANISIGTFCHENGHMICDFPDLYSYDGSAANMGGFSLMASSGSTHPKNVDPYLKIHAGWADVVDLTSASQLQCAVQQDRNFFYRYKNPAKATEYFLFEVRGTAGYEGVWNGAGVTNPANGLVVYHALQTGSNTYSTIITADTTTNYTTPFELMVVESAPSTTVIPWYDDPTPGSNDAYAAGGVSSVSDITTPNLKFWAADGRTVASGANINSISAAGATMTFIAGAGPLPATPTTTVTATQFQPNTDFGENAANHSFSVFNSGGGTLSYTVSDNAAWLACAPASDTATTEADLIAVSYTTAALAAGTYTATITIDGGSAGIKTIGVTLTVNPRPTLASSVSSFSLPGVAGTTGPTATFNISNSGGGTVAYTLTKTQPWLSLDRASGTVSIEQDLVAVTFNATSLAKGTYTDTITIASTEATNSPLTIPVTFSVDGADMIVAAPNGGESWVRGTTQTITWASGIGGNVKIELFKNGVLNTTVSGNTPNDGSFSWSIPAGQTLGSNYRIRITSIETPTTSDQSFADFTIAPPPIYYASMDTNPGWTLGTSWAYGVPTGAGQDGYGGPDPTSGSNGTNVIGYRLDGDYEQSLTSTSWATTPAINCTGRQNVKLSFQRWLGVENSQYDHVYVEVSNNGSTWTRFWENPTSDTNDTAWTYCEYDISSVANGQAAVYVRWGLGGTDGSWNFCGWNIDEVLVDGDLTGGGYAVAITPSGGTTDVTEGGATDTYTVRLTQAPANNVTVNITPNSQVTVSPSSLTFTTGNWATPQTVTVTAFNDLANEFAHTGTINHSATSSDTNYNAIGIDGIVVNITDNDNTAPASNAGPNQTVYLVGDVWSPANLSPIAWYDATDAATITSAGGSVSQWSSKAGTSHMLQATGTKQPKTSTNQINGLNTIAFDGTDDALKTAANPFGASISNAMFMAVTNIGTVASATMFSLSSSTTNRWQSHAPWGDGVLYFDCGGASGTNRINGATGWAASQNKLLGYYCSTTDNVQQVWVDGTSFVSDATGHTVTVSSGLALGHDGTSSYDNCTMGEVVILDGTVSTLNRQKLEGHLAHKWGLQGSLPAGHPYKTQSPTNATAVANLDGTVSDANGDALTTVWSVVSGPASVSFGNANAVDTTATFTVEGIYTLRLSASDPGATTSADVVITVGTAAGYVVSYDGNGNTGGTVPTNQVKTTAVNLTLATNSGSLVRAGYTYAGWNTAANGSGTNYAAGATYSTDANLALFAKWTPNSYTVTFDANGGSVPTPASKSVTFNAVYGTLATTSRANYTFSGWFTAASGGSQVTDVTSVTNASNHTLYAQWTGTPYTVTFDANGGTAASPASKSVNFAGTYGTLATTSRVGYTYNGWFTAASGGTQVTDVTNVTNASNHTLYAQWTIATYVIAYDGNGSTGGTAPINQTKTHDVAVTLSGAGTLIRTGYAFAGWNTAANGSGTAYAAAASYTVNAAATLYAQWTGNTYTVTFDANGGYAPSPTSMSVTYNSAYGTLATITRAGYTFMGWFTAASGGTKVDATTTVTTAGDHTLYAQWVNSLTWDANATGSGQTNGAGAWLSADLWWNGIANQSWTDGSNAVIGGPNTAGGAVTLASPTSVNNITFNTFTGTYTLGTVGQALTINGGITMNATSGVVSLSASPIILGGAQTWTNNSASSLNVTVGLNNNSNLLTFDGSGTISFGTNTTGIITGGGGITMNGAGRLQLGSGSAPAHDYSGTTTLNAGVTMVSNGNLGTGNLTMNGGVIETYWATNFIRALGSGAGQIQITGGVSGFGVNGSIGASVIFGNSAANEAVWGSAYFNPSTLVLQTQYSQNNSSLNFQNKIDLNGATRTIHVSGGVAGTATATLSGVIRNSTGTAGIIKTGNGQLFLTGANTYNGPTTVSAGMVDFGAIALAGFGGGTGRNISVAADTIVRRNTLDNAFLNRLVETTVEFTVMTGTTANNLDFSSSSGANLPNAFLGNWAGNGAKCEYSGTLTPASDSYRLGSPIGNNGLLGLTNSSPMIGTRGLIVGGGSVELVGAKTFTGDTTIRNGARLGLAAFTGSSVALGLQNSVLDTGTVSNTGTIWFESGGAGGPITGSAATTSAVFGGLKGSRNLTSVYAATTGANNSAATAVSAVTGFTLNPGTGISLTYSGAIADFATGTTLTKTGLGTQILAGTNTYTGATNVNQGKLSINGSLSNLAAVFNVGNGATLGGTGTIGRTVTIADGGKLEFDISTNAATHNGLDISTGRDFAFTAASELTITSSGGAAPGTYTLITGGNNITGVVPATVNLPVGWAATVSITGNSLFLNVTSISGGGTYTIDYNGNGNDGGTAPANQIKNLGVDLTLSGVGSLSKTGYSFIGWNTAANGSGTPYAAGANYTADSAVTLYAQWSINSYTLTFNSAGGSAVTPITQNFGTSVTAPASPIRSGYTFAGWSPAVPATMPANDLTVTAQWTINQYTVTFDANGGDTPIPASQSATYDSAYGTLATTSRTGYSFTGWFTAASGGTEVTAATIFTATANHTLYAQWNALPAVNAGSDQNIALNNIVWSPLELNPGLWLDAADSATITLNGTTVSQWGDKSGNNRHATQGTATNQATNTPTGLNGKRVLTFDASSDFFSVNLDFLAGVSHSAFIVTKPTTFNNIYGAANGNAGASSLHVGFNGTAYRMNYWSNDYIPARTANFIAGSANIMNYIWTSGTSKQILANGKSEGTNPSAGVIGTMSGGGRICNVVGQGYFGGDIAEIIIIPAAITAANREKFEGYLAHKWGLAANLAVGHPYKDAAPVTTGVVATLDGTVSDAEGDTVTATWSKVSGPAATVSFANASAVDTTATFTAEGVYTLRLAASTIPGSNYDECIITVGPAITTYNVTYDGNGNTGGTVPVDGSSPYASGSTVSALGNTGALAKTGYSFAGWNTAANGSGTGYATGNTFTISADTTLHAQWTANTYAVTYNVNGATSGTAPADQTKTHDVSLTLATNSGTLSRTGYTFASWNTQTDGLGNDYAAGGSYTDNTTLALYAKWTVNPYTITFDSAGGSAVAAITQNFGTTVTAPTDPTRTGYTFDSWSPVIPTTIPANDLAVTAQWTLNSYTLNYAAGAGGTLTGQISQTVNHGANGSAVTAVPSTGYNFVKWSDNVMTASRTDTNITAGLSVTANFALITYTSWADGTFAGTLSNKNMAFDFDGDGLATGVEWVIGTDPTLASDASDKKPVFDNTTDPEYFLYRYRRTDVANADPKTSIAVEYGNDLIGWITAVDDGTNLIITPSNDFHGTGVDQVEVKIKRTVVAPGGILFSRLKVVISP